MMAVAQPQVLAAPDSSSWPPPSLASNLPGDLHRETRGGIYTDDTSARLGQSVPHEDLSSSGSVSQFEQFRKNPFVRPASKYFMSTQPERSHEVGTLGANVPGFAVPQNHEVERSIEESRLRIRRYSDDEQLEVLLTQFGRARDFVVSTVADHCSSRVALQELPVPSIDFGPEEDSIDVNWQNETKRLLVNFSASESEVSFAGIHKGGTGPSIRGTVNPHSSNAWLVTWLTE